MLKESRSPSKPPLPHELALKRYTLNPKFSNTLGQLSKDLANISNYHEAMLNRIDAKCTQQLDNLPNMEKQLNVQLECYAKNLSKYEKQYALEQKPARSWENFFTPSPIRRQPFSFGQGGMSMGQMGNSFGMNQMQTF